MSQCCNITSIILGIVCNMPSIPLYVSHSACMLLPFLLVLHIYNHIFHGDDVLRAPQNVHVHNLRKFVYGDSDSLSHCKGVCGWYASMTHTRYHPFATGTLWKYSSVALLGNQTHHHLHTSIPLLHEVCKLLQLKGLQMIPLLNVYKKKSFP